LRRELYPLAKLYKEYINFVTIDTKQYGYMAVGLGLSSREEDYPVFTVYSAWKDQVFPYPEGQRIKEDSIEAFLLEIFHGTRSPWNPNGPKEALHDEL
jgi:protein disulfide-isomerase A1